jgi:hypothetical protein
MDVDASEHEMMHSMHEWLVEQYNRADGRYCSIGQQHNLAWFHGQS